MVVYTWIIVIVMAITFVNSDLKFNKFQLYEQVERNITTEEDYCPASTTALMQSYFHSDRDQFQVNKESLIEEKEEEDKEDNVWEGKEEEGESEDDLASEREERLPASTEQGQENIDVLLQQQQSERLEQGAELITRDAGKKAETIRQLLENFSDKKEEDGMLFIPPTIQKKEIALEKISPTALEEESAPSQSPELEEDEASPTFQEKECSSSTLKEPARSTPEATASIHNESVIACDCDDVPPPVVKVEYDCRKEYLPYPGEESSYMLSAFAWIRDTTLNTVPTNWGEWVCHNRRVYDIFFTSTAWFFFFVPFIYILRRTCAICKERGKLLQKEEAACLELDMLLRKAETDKENLEKQVKDLQIAHQNVSEGLGLITIERDEVFEEKKNLEIHCQRISESLSQSKTSLNQHVKDSEQLSNQIVKLQQQLETVQRDKELVLEQRDALQSQVKELEKNVLELEAQLEHDKFDAVTNHEKLEAHHQQTMSELQSERDRCSSLESDLQTERDRCSLLESDLQTTSTSLEQELKKRAEKEEEVKAVRNCLQQIIDRVLVRTAPEANGVEEEGAGVQPSKEARLKALLDTAKVQGQLREVEADRDRITEQLKLKLEELSQSTAKNVELGSEVAMLKSELTSTKDELWKSEIQKATIIEYFHKKELDLHSKLEAGKRDRQQLESLVSEAEEKERIYEEDRVAQKRQLDSLKAEMKEIVASYVRQAKNHECRAKEAAADFHHTEQDLRLANREVVSYKKRIAELENVLSSSAAKVHPIPQRSSNPPPKPRPRPPNSLQGPPPAAQPISAPQLEPQTSSPSNLPPSDPMGQPQAAETAQQLDTSSGAGGSNPPLPQEASPPPQLNTSLPPPSDASATGFSSMDDTRPAPNTSFPHHSGPSARSGPPPLWCAPPPPSAYMGEGYPMDWDVPYYHHPAHYQGHYYPPLGHYPGPYPPPHYHQAPRAAPPPAMGLHPQEGSLRWLPPSQQQEQTSAA